MGYLSTHVLDSAHGRPGKGIRIDLFAMTDQRTLLKSVYTNDDGRCDEPLLEKEEFKPGIYELVFYTTDYFKSQGIEQPDPAFLGEVVIRFGVASADEHYHVPLLIAPYSYSTYRGS